MNKQDLRYAYLNYFRNQYAHNELIESKTLIEMAPNGKIANEVIRELVAEELIEGIDFVDGDEKGLSLVTDEVVKLTEKGKNEINKMNFAQRLAEDTKQEEKNEKLWQKFIMKEKERIARLSLEGKEEELKIRILKHFDYLNSQIDKYENKQIKVKELKENLKQLVSHYFDKAPQIYAKKITTNLVNEGYITYLYQKDSSGSVDIDKLLTNKAKSYLVQLEKENNERLEQYCKEHNIKFPKINIPIGAIKAYQNIANPALIVARNHLPTVQKIFSTPGLLDVINNINYPALENAIKAANTYYSNVSTNINKEDKNNSDTDKDYETYTFEGILGYNCGEVVTPTSIDSKRIQERGFKVKDGLRVLRGYANSSILAFASQKDSKKYQREENQEHLEAIENFVEKIRPSAKYLPEVTLVARGYENLEKIELSGKLNDTQQGELDNLEYYKLTVNINQLFRIDGNHRLEALKTGNYYIPFSIIIWEEDENNPDDEAFLFYFLNSKARRLTTEENLKGLVNTSSWADYELIEANKYIPHLKFLKEQFDNNPLINTTFCNNKPLKLIAELLEKVDAYIDIEEFKQIAICMGQLLIKNLWPSLLKFNFYCQLLFYVAYKTKSLDQAINTLNNLESWVVKYNFDDTTFNDPILLFNNAEKTNNLNPINIFVAMRYDEININNYTEWIKIAIQNIETNKPQFKNRLNLYNIMRHRGYNIDLIDDIMQKISECSIFIADISSYETAEGVICDANPNVMYELGIAHKFKKPIILMREGSNFPPVPSDIQEKYRNSYNKSDSQGTREILQNAINNILEDYYG
ncbi:hypothetical protein IJX73_01975 [bacterium]|nr:hypothetical protein [bacterium]MBQ9149677.1 hypothetical protein [bacterium]